MNSRMRIVLTSPIALAPTFGPLGAAARPPLGCWLWHSAPSIDISSASQNGQIAADRPAVLGHSWRYAGKRVAVVSAHLAELLWASNPWSRP